MKTFDRIIVLILAVVLAVFAAANLYLRHRGTDGDGRPWRVEIERLAHEIEDNGMEHVDLSECLYVTSIEKSGENFYDTDSDYTIQEINGEAYRFDYAPRNSRGQGKSILAVNISLAILSTVTIGVLLFVRNKILAPFERLKTLPHELSRGNLGAPLKENKSHFFGKFLWGIDLLREHIEEQHQRELRLQKEKNTLLLSLSHDIKTPLSAIKLYAGTLAKNLYPDRKKQNEIAEKINQKADEIENYISQITTASREDFLSLSVKDTEFYLADLTRRIQDYYTEKLAVVHTDFHMGEYQDCLLSGDPDRGIEVMQNIIENAIKYGDGHRIGITFSRDEDCQLITIENSGCTLSDTDLPHIFDSFWRGANAGHTQGSGLGLYICRQLMHKMKGEIFARIQNGCMLVTIVFVMAG